MADKKKQIPKHSVSKGLLPDKIALVKGFENGDVPNFKISYDYYDGNHCEIEDLAVAAARKCLIKLKYIGQSNPKTLIEKNIKSKPVIRTGRYLALFSKLTDDVNLFEIDIGEASRLFYFILGNLFHIVAIKNSHIKY
jgi:hypothetical protein